MGIRSYEEILQDVTQLPSDQRLMLIARIAQQLSTAEGSASAPAWEDYAASAPYPLCGEDAQKWVGRTRAESDESRGLE